MSTRRTVVINIAQAIGSRIASPGDRIDHIIKAVDAAIDGLVFIDPEGREQVERLTEELYVYGLTIDKAHPTSSYVGDGFKAGMCDRVEAALREFANPTPPKPDEPTGLGAVIEDADGVRWVRNEPGDDCKWRSDDGGWLEYNDIAAVRVLSEGVPND